MPHSRIINHDEDLHVRLGGRQGPGPGVRLPSLGKTTTSRPAVQAIVKVDYMRSSRVKGYAQYIERDGTAGPIRDGTTAAQGYSGYIAREGAGEDGQRAQLFTRVGQVVDREAFMNRSHGDPRAWTIIVSPGSNNLDMERYIREFMVQVELDLGKKLDYLAAIHRNTKYTHAHILMRGKDREGRSFRLPQDYMTQGLRGRATEIAHLFRALGYVREPQMVRPPVLDQSRIVRLQRALWAWIRQHAREGRGH
jgi:hypothetical protein